MDTAEYCKKLKNSRQDYPAKCALRNELAEADNTLRKLFSQQRESWVVPELEDPHQSLIPAFDHPELFQCLPELPQEAAIPKVFSLGASRLQPGTPSIVGPSEFHRNFNELFTEGALKYMNWKGVFAAGGSVMACLQPLPKKHDGSNRSRRRFMHDEGFPASDVDLFLYGMNAEEAKTKITEIYEAVCEAVPFNVLCFRSAHTITMVSEYPFRHIQIVLRLYSSPLEILSGFDVDSCAVGYDGTRVWITQRSHLALVTQTNPVNLTRRSMTYEMRLAKYAQRGFEVPVPELDRTRIDPTLFERQWNKVEGLAKLLLLEKLRTPEARFRYKEQHSFKKMQNLWDTAFARRFGLRGMMRNPWIAPRMEKLSQGADASDYSTVFLPWGRGYNAQKCKTFMLAKDKILNSPYISKDREYRLHPCFIGTAEEVIKDCALDDPPIPSDADQKVLQGYVRGPLTFLEDNPGRQMIGSFHPIENNDWADGAYITVEMDALSAAVNANDDEAVMSYLQSGLSPNRPDFAGRSPLHIAALANSIDCARRLLHFNARMIQRMPDGRSVLHICAAYGREQLMSLILEKSHENQQAEEREEKASAGDGSPDDAEESCKLSKREPPDILDVDVEEWTNKMTPLQVAIMFGHAKSVELLLKYGADPNKGWRLGDVEDHDYQVAPILALVMNLASWNKQASCEILALLLENGCDMLRLNQSLENILHLAARRGSSEFIEQIFQVSPEMKSKAVNAISVDLETPLALAVSNNHEACARVLLENGATIEVSDADCQLARRRSNAIHSEDWSVRNRLANLRSLIPEQVPYPLWSAVSTVPNRMDCAANALDVMDEEEENAAMGGRQFTSCNVEKNLVGVIHLLLDYGANVNFMMESRQGETMIDYIENQLEKLTHKEEQEKKKRSKFLAKFDKSTSVSQAPYIIKDGVNVSTETSLPLAFTPQNCAWCIAASCSGSYIQPTVEAKALELDIELLMETDSEPKHISLFSRKRIFEELLDLLKKAGGLKYSEIQKTKPVPKKEKKRRDDNSSTNDETKYSAIEKEIARYYLLKPSEGDEDFGCSGWRQHGNRNLGMLLETHKQTQYHALFEAVWNGDADHVERVTLQGPKEDHLFVCVENAYGQTPLSLAILKGHTHLAARLLEIAALQFTRKKKNKVSQDGLKGLETGFVNNYAIEDMLEEQSDEGDESEEHGESDDWLEDAEEEEDALLSEMNEMRANAQKAAQSAAAKEAGVSADIGYEAIHECHVSPADLLGHVGAFPFNLVDANLPERFRWDAKRFFRLLWKFGHDSDAASLEELNGSFGYQPDTYHYSRRQFSMTFHKVSILQLIILLKNVDLLNVFFDACEKWNCKWFAEDIETKTSNDATELACKLASDRKCNPGILDLAICMDDEALLSCLIERVGGSIDFSKLTHNLNRSLKQKNQPGGRERSNYDNAIMDLVTGIDDFEFEDISKPLRATTMLHTATDYDSKRIVKWILSGGPIQAFASFLDKSSRSAAAQSALKLGRMLLGCEFQGISDQESAPAALSAFRSGYLESEDKMKRNIFHIAIRNNSSQMMEYILKTAKSLGLANSAMAAIDKPQLVQPPNRNDAEYHPYALEFVSGTSPLQAAALGGRVDCFKFLLDSGANIEVPDGISSRGWNILGFCTACTLDDASQKPRHQGSTNNKRRPEKRTDLRALQLIKGLVQHPRVGSEKVQQMLSQHMGDSRVTPLMIAANMGHAEVVQGFMHNGACSSQDADGSTLVHLATKKKKKNVIETLIGNRAVEVTNRESQEIEFSAAASQEDHMGRVPMDISMQATYRSQQQSLRRHSDPQSMLGDIGIYSLIRGASCDGKRKRSSFNNVQASAIRATELAEKRTAPIDYMTLPYHQTLVQQSWTSNDALQRCSGSNW